MRIGYNEATARDCSSLEQDLILCEKEGFDDIEIRLDMLQAYLKTHTVSDLQRFFSKSRIRPAAFNALYLYSEFLSNHDDDERKKELLEEFKLGCEVGAAIDDHYFIIVPPLQRDPQGGPYVGNTEQTFQDCTRILKKLSELAEPYKMNLCFELVGFDRSSVRSIAEADKIVRTVDRHNVGFVFDSYNIYLNSGRNDFAPIELVQPEKIFDIHMMSADEVKAEDMGQDKRCFCDRGVVDIDLFLKTIKKTGYKGTVSIETFRPEYWAKSPEWVIHNAFVTTKAAMQKNDCL